MVTEAHVALHTFTLSSKRRRIAKEEHLFKLLPLFLFAPPSIHRWGYRTPLRAPAVLFALFFTVEEEHLFELHPRLRFAPPSFRRWGYRTPLRVPAVFLFFTLMSAITFLVGCAVGRPAGDMVVHHHFSGRTSPLPLIVLFE